VQWAHGPKVDGSVATGVCGERVAQDLHVEGRTARRQRSRCRCSHLDLSHGSLALAIPSERAHGMAETRDADFVERDLSGD
jgi:hypothetical protein